MSRRTLAFIALAISMLYGAGFAAFRPAPAAYATIGGVIVALAWISVGMFGKEDPTQSSSARTSPQPPEDAPPYGTPPQDR